MQWQRKRVRLLHSLAVMSPMLGTVVQVFFGLTPEDSSNLNSLIKSLDFLLAEARTSSSSLLKAVDIDCVSLKC